MLKDEGGNKTNCPIGGECLIKDKRMAARRAIQESTKVIGFRPLHVLRPLTAADTCRALGIEPAAAFEFFVHVVWPPPFCATIISQGEVARALLSVRAGATVTVRSLPADAWADELVFLAAEVLEIQVPIAS